MNNFTSSNTKAMLDIRGHLIAKAHPLTDGVKLSYADQLGPVMYLDGIDDWIIVKSIRNKCIMDPTNCSKGLTVAFWINYTKGTTIFDKTF